MKSLINWFKRDVKEDIDTLKYMYVRLITGQPVLDPDKVKEVKEEFKGMGIGGFFKQNGMWLLAILFALVIGWLISAKFYQLQCNNFVYENYIKQNLSMATDLLWNKTY